jgi:hypothetical protein
VLVAAREARAELGDRLGLVAARLEVAHELEPGVGEGGGEPRLLGALHGRGSGSGGIFRS